MVVVFGSLGSPEWDSPMGLPVAPCFPRQVKTEAKDLGRPEVRSLGWPEATPVVEMLCVYVHLSP